MVRMCVFEIIHTGLFLMEQAIPPDNNVYVSLPRLSLKPQKEYVMTVIINLLLSAL